MAVVCSALHPILSDVYVFVILACLIACITNVQCHGGSPIFITSECPIIPVQGSFNAYFESDTRITPPRISPIKEVKLFRVGSVPIPSPGSCPVTSGSNQIPPYHIRSIPRPHIPPQCCVVTVGINAVVSCSLVLSIHLHNMVPSFLPYAFV